MATHSHPSPSPAAFQFPSLSTATSTTAALPTAKLPCRPVRKGSVGKQPLVPASEVHHYHLDSSASKTTRETESQKWDSNLETASPARDGRQFTVSNVGNNGRIYLRPSVRKTRPISQNHQRLNTTKPPPQSSHLRSPTSTQDPIAVGSPPTQWTLFPNFPVAASTTAPSDASTTTRRTNHRRPLSDSTIHEALPPKKQDTTPAAAALAQISIEDGARPRTMDDGAASTPMLEINIPNWRIGTPRFTVRGTALIRGSSYAPTEELRCSTASIPDSLPPSLQTTIDLTQPAALFPHTQPSLQNASSNVRRPSSPVRLRTMRSVSQSTNFMIQPDMFTSLTFRPASDDARIVRYSSATGTVAAATPPRLVAEITSPTFLDYELISDFFLTYRAFLDSLHLLRMLFARMRWALARQDEIGMIVRVRTFVATRHWILNYFTDDFLLNHPLRKEFCDLLNDVVDDLSDDVQTRNVQLRVIAELKKCWRRVCAHYWDGPSFDDSLGVEATVVPGGIAGHRDPTLTPSYWQDIGQEPPLSSTLVRNNHGTDTTGFSTDPNKTPNISDFIVFGDRPLTPENIAMDLARAQEKASPISLDSADVISCSFAAKTLRGVASHSNNLWAAHPHPVASTAQATRQGAVAVPPRVLAGKRLHLHKRSNSVSDSLRDHRSERPHNGPEFPTILPSAGSLVRGNVIPPGQAVVDTPARDYAGMPHRQTTVFAPPAARRIFKDKPFNGAMSGIGMRKLLTSVRRALSARGQVVSPTQANLTRISPLGPPDAASNRLPGTAVVPQQDAQHTGPRPTVRVDLLGAEVAEEFKKAVREEQAAILPTEPPPVPLPLKSSGHRHFPADLPPIDHHRPTSDMGITTGSKSIVIVDDTVPFDVSQSRVLQPSEMPSMETLPISLMHAVGDPTPPNTPPTIVNRHNSRSFSSLVRSPASQSPDALPPFVPDLATLQQGEPHMSEHMVRPSFSSSSRQSRRYPPLSGGTVRLNKGSRSFKTQQSLNSILHRRHSSIGGGILSPSTLGGSIDATTLSEASIDGSDVPMPEPLRVLRRRPGGDLRAATKVDDLQHTILRRSQSVGSIVTYSESARSLSFLGASPASNTDGESNYDDYHHQGRQEVFSVGQLAMRKPPSPTKLSLLSMSSSKPPPAAPSFEAEAQMLAQIPDEDDGGIESTLLKLEGKYDRKSNGSPQGSRESGEEIDMGKLGQALQFLGGAPAKSATGRRHDKSNALNIELNAGEEVHGRCASRSEVTRSRSFLSEVSSYNSTPLLARDLTEDGGSSRETGRWTGKSIMRDSEDFVSIKGNWRAGNASVADAGSALTDRASASADQGYDVVEKTESMERIMPGETQPVPLHHQSLVEDKSYANPNASSKVSHQEPASPTAVASLLRPRRKLPPHPLSETISDAMLHPISPPLSTPRKPLSPALKAAESMYATRPLPPTPDTTPTAPHTQTLGGADASPTSSGMPRAVPQPEPGAKKFSVHLPFILAFDSETLAQQFTLIEKDALNEIDWKELIEMNWKNATSSGSRSWVEFLRNSDAHGVEVVIARFNIMVKWAISEIVLTQHVEERARCIIKMIHIAAHCRRHRNFATLAQLTIALSSNEVVRLSRTWSMVPSHDLRTLSELETLITPTRNFLNLRAEMEMGTDTGCIPFVGIYTHDLLYNAQRPAEVTNSPDAPPLVNFERCRIAAAVVKVLLRLLESSTRYTFEPMEGITERCLWVGALSDEEIRGHAEALES